MQQIYTTGLQGFMRTAFSYRTTSHGLQFLTSLQSRWPWRHTPALQLAPRFQPGPEK